jgi:hypothetical protein
MSIWGAVGSIAGGLIGSAGASDANQAARKLARENREWQKMMSDTAYQRAAVDLKRAGLNRILAIGSPASTPAGNVAPVMNEKAALGQGVTSAAMMAAQVKQIKAQTQLTQAQTRALSGAAEAGEGIGEIIATTKKRSTSLYEDYKNKDTSWMPSAKGQLARPGAAKLTDSLEKRRRTAEQNLASISKSVGLSPDKTKRILLNTLNNMDLPKDWTDGMKLQWALENPERIRNFIERNKTK